MLYWIFKKQVLDIKSVVRKNVSKCLTLKAFHLTYKAKNLYRNKKKKSYIYMIDKSKNNFNYADKGKSPGGRN